MSSFALWFGASKNVTENYWADVHFNLWNLHYKQARPPCLDIGIKIYAPQGYSKVFFYVPFAINKKDICDLGQYLKTTEILCTVFNEDYTVAQEAHSKVLHIENNIKSSIINIYCLDKVYKCNWQTIIIYLSVAGILAILFDLISQLLI
jgi:hypothetical protein